MRIYLKKPQSYVIDSFGHSLNIVYKIASGELKYKIRRQDSTCKGLNMRNE